MPDASDTHRVTIQYGRRRSIPYDLLHGVFFGDGKVSALSTRERQILNFLYVEKGPFPSHRIHDVLRPELCDLPKYLKAQMVCVEIFHLREKLRSIAAGLDAIIPRGTKQGYSFRERK